MNRRAFTFGLAAALGAPTAVQALQDGTIYRALAGGQSRRIPRLAVVCVLRCGDELRLSGTGAFLDSLALHGYEADRDFILDRRYAGISATAISGAAIGVVNRRPDIIVVFDSGAVTRVIHEARSGIPIVAVGVLRAAVSELLATEGSAAGIAAVTLPYERIIVEQYALLNELTQGPTRVAILYNSNNPDHVKFSASIPALAAPQTESSRAFGLGDVRDTGPVFGAIADWQAGGVVVLADEVFAGSGITVEALRRRLPTIGLYAQFARGGGLMSYGPSSGDVYGQGAALVARIIGGAKQATAEDSLRLRLTINRTTARAVGLTIPPSLLLRADQVIE